MQAPKDGYDLPLWGLVRRERATAHAYLKRTKELVVKNVDGNSYALATIEQSMLGNK